MKLNELIQNLQTKKVVGYIKDIEIDNITISSREKLSNSLFIAQKGVNFDGNLFIEESIINGAIALVLEEELPNYNVPQIIVKDTRKALAVLASEFYGNPKDKLKFIGVTGTNGKTSCALFAAQILNDANIPCAFIGTLGANFLDKKYSSNLTTPDPIIFHRLLSEFVQDGAQFVSMECSAHAIYLQKISNIQFEVGIITNITEDHLDYFKTMKNYANAKLEWFSSGNIHTAIVNCDDKYCKSLIKKKIRLLTYGLDNPADVFAVNIESGKAGTSFVLNILDNVLTCNTKLSGIFNIYNIMAVATAAVAVGVPFESVKKSISNLNAPTGRFNIISLPENKTIIIDFAHTPDGLEKVLITAKQICKGKLICLFGCGGDRDKLKRPIMGAIAEKFSDFIVLTSDNPRFEKPENILAEIEKGIKGTNYLKISDRRLAISKVIEMMRPNDIALICGKGGEVYQDINGIKLPYNDFEEIKRAVKTILNIDCKSEEKEQIC